MDPTKTIAGLAGGGGLAASIAYFANRFGAHITNDDVAHFVPVFGVIGAVVAHGGLLGLWRAFWNGLVKGAGSSTPAA